MNSSISTNMYGSASEHTLDGNKLLKVTVDYPVFISHQYSSAFAKINSKIRTQAKAFHEYSMGELYPAAVSRYYESKRVPYPATEYEAMLVYMVPYTGPGMLSVYNDRYEFTGGAHGSTVRSSDTWNLQTGGEVRLNMLFPAGFDFRTYITNEVQRQAAEQMADGTKQYFDNYREQIVEHFNENSFYLDRNGLVVYYQQYDIAPYSSGIPEFHVALVS